MSIYVAPRTAPAVKAGPIGPGAGVLLTEYPLASILGQQKPADKIRNAYRLGIEVPWIRTAEKVIGEKFSTVPWHLEDRDGTEIDDDYPSPLAQEARSLLEKPAANLDVGSPVIRSDMWFKTSRHMGLTGTSFWFLDQVNAYGIPASFVYLNPDRMTPGEDANGNLKGWWIDRGKNGPADPGIAVSVEQVLRFTFEPPDYGHFGVGLVESALVKAQLSGGVDRHLAQVLSAGGRLSGFLAPKQGDALNNDQYSQLVNDFRTVVEQPDAAKRLQILRGPVEFTQTTMTPEQLQIRDLMTGLRDDLLGMWGVPLSKLGIHDRGRGLGATEATDKDDETLWKNAVDPRLVRFREMLQFQVFDRYAAAGLPLELVIDAPTFEDDTPKYDIAQKALNLPLRNIERRAIIGLEPLGEHVIGESGQPADDEVWLPATMVLAYTANEKARNEPPPPPVQLVPPPVEDNERAAAAAGESNAPAPRTPATAQKANTPFHDSLVRLRENLQKNITPRLRSAVAPVLAEQRAEIAARLRKHADHVAANPKDSAIWFDQGKWDDRLRHALAAPLMGAAQTVNLHVRELLPPAKAGPAGAVDRVLARGAARVTGINATTREKIQQAVIRGLDEGFSILQVADLVEGITVEGPVREDIGLDLGSLFDDYRAELIARTELMDAYNGAALGSYADAGVSQVQAIDGDGDEECAARDGQVFDIDEADGIEDHPNGTLDWVPVIGKADPLVTAMQAQAQALKAIAARPDPVVNVYNSVAQPDIHVTTPDVHVTSPEVRIEQGAVQVTLEAAKAEPVRQVHKRVVRDDAGRITDVIEG